MNAKKIMVKVPKDYRFVTTLDGHCHQIESAYIEAEFKPDTILVSKEGKKVSYYDVANHADNLFNAIDGIFFHKGKEFYFRNVDGCDAMFGINGAGSKQTIVATIDKKGNLVLLPYDEQKPYREFVVTDEHRKTFNEYQKRLMRYRK